MKTSTTRKTVLGLFFTALTVLANFSSPLAQPVWVINPSPDYFPEYDGDPRACVVTGKLVPRDNPPCVVLCLLGPEKCGEFNEEIERTCAELAPGESATGQFVSVRKAKEGTGTSHQPIYFEGHPRCAKISGDPHLRTFDGQSYDLQAAGEFVAVASLDNDLEIQVRLEAASGPASVSYVTAIASRLNGKRVVISARGEQNLRIEGQAVDLPDRHVLQFSDNEAAGMVRQGGRRTLIWPDGTTVHVDLRSHYLDSHLLPAKQNDGRLVGLFGNSDGQQGRNDFVTRDGQQLEAPPEYEQRYRVFAESWRVRPEESLFDYGPGESTETFTRRDVPASDVKIDDINQADRDRAESLCREAGVSESEALDECIYDVALTGDEEYIASALSQQKPESQSSRQVKIEAPSEAIASSPVEVRISGPAVAGYVVLFAPVGSDIDGRSRNPYSSPLT